MHKSKLGRIHHRLPHGRSAAGHGFLEQRLGAAGSRAAGGRGSFYRKLYDAHSGLDIEVQKVDHPSRVHLDIETDDIEAEVRRLELLGAKRVQQVETWWVMEAPTGQRFCVVQASSAKFAQHASQWP